MKSIIIDAGHGGRDSGAVGFGTLEKDYSLKMSLYQYRRLKELGAKVALTRDSDRTLESFNRVALIKDRYDICISNHWNAFNGKARGVETIHSYRAKPDFAKALAQSIVKASGLPLRRVFSRKTNNQKSDYYFMHRLTGSTRTVIIEYGFIDHKEDHNYYENHDHFYKVAEAVIAVICKELGVKYKKPSRNSVSVKKPPVTTPKLKQTSQNNKSSTKRLTSIYNGQLRFYKKPSWEDQDVYGYLQKGYGFPKVIRKLKVGKGHQYEVKNSKGDTYYVTASPKYVSVK